MSVVIETTLGDITVDLYINRRPRACLNFLKLCKIKYYNYNLFHTVSRGFIAQTGDPTGSRTGGESIYGVLDGQSKRYFEPELNPKIKHTAMGLISFVGNNDKMIGSQFFFTLGADLNYLDDNHCVFGEVVEGLDVLEIINEAICDADDRPYQDIRITHTVVLDDPLPDPERLIVPSRSPSPSAERLQGGRIAPDEEIDETAGKTAQEIQEMIAEREAKARATILEMVGDIPDADVAPPENVLFVCKLNPVTTDDDLEIIFSRFGKIKSCEVIRDKKTGDSLQYAFIEFEEQKSCEDAYFKMDNVLIDDRRVHVDFSQSVAKVKWLGKGRGVRNYGEKDRDIGKGNYQKNGNKYNRNKRSRSRDKSRIDNLQYRRDKNRRDNWNRRERSRSRERNRRHRLPENRVENRGRRDRSRSFDTSKSDRRGKSSNRRNDNESSTRNIRHRSSTPNVKKRKKEKSPGESESSEDERRKNKHKNKKKKEHSSDSESDNHNSKRKSKKKKIKKKRKRNHSTSSSDNNDH